MGGREVGGPEVDKNVALPFTNNRMDNTVQTRVPESEANLLVVIYNTDTFNAIPVIVNI